MKRWISMTVLVGVVTLCSAVIPGWIAVAVAHDRVGAGAAAAAAATAADDDDDDDGGTNRTDVDAATQVKKKYENSIMTQSGVMAVGVGEDASGRVGIHVYVRQGGPRPAIANQLDGVPVTVIEAAPFVAHDGNCDGTPPCHDDVEALPVPMGTSTGNVNGVFAGTLGYRVRRIGPTTSEVGYITNNHVAAASGGSLCPAQVNPANLAAFGVDQCQPGLLDAGGACVAPKIGDLVQVVPIVMGTSYLNTVDAAFVRSNRRCVSKNIRDIGAPGATAAMPLLGSILKLSGRTSGLITIKVSTINATVDIFYGVGCGSARFVNQAITIPVAPATAASRPGDSGAPVVTTTRLPRGLNFAGNGFNGIINPMPLVLNALGVQIDTALDQPYLGGTCP
jgi:hypothetical protein